MRVLGFDIGISFDRLVSARKWRNYRLWRSHISKCRRCADKRIPCSTKRRSKANSQNHCSQKGENGKSKNNDLQGIWLKFG